MKEFLMRSVFPQFAGGLLALSSVLGLSACSSEPEIPEGYQLYTKGNLSMVLPENMVEPEETKTPLSDYWDVYVVDTPDPTAPRAGLGIIGTTDLQRSDPREPARDAEAALDFILVVDPLGMPVRDRSEPIDLSRDGDTILRQPSPPQSKTELHYWAIEDGETGQVAVLCLGGDDVTPEVVEIIDQTLTFTEGEA